MPGKVYLNGNFVDKDKAMIPVEDRGFMLGDGVYEVVRVYDGKPFFLDKHLERMQQGLNAISIDFDVKELPDICTKILELNACDNGNLYIQVTRGVAKRQHHFPENIKPTVLVMSYPAKDIPEEYRTKGVKAILVEDIRWNKCFVKTIQLLPNAMAKQKAKEAGAYEAIFYKDGKITEGSSSNVFIVKNGKIITYPLRQNILGGITRNIVMDIINDKGFDVSERDFTVDELLKADEVFLTGTTTEVMPVVKIDETKISNGKPGEITRAIADRYDELKEKAKR